MSDAYRRPAQGKEMGLQALIGLALEPVAKRVRRWRLEARLRSLQRLADYFEWQETNGRAGLADTHRRIALTKSDIARLR